MGLFDINVQVWSQKTFLSCQTHDEKQNHFCACSFPCGLSSDWIFWHRKLIHLKFSSVSSLWPLTACPVRLVPIKKTLKCRKHHWVYRDISTVLFIKVAFYDDALALSWFLSFLKAYLLYISHLADASVQRGSQVTSQEQLGVYCLAHAHYDIWIGGARDQTSNPAVSGKHALSPEQ